jgi:modulator of FtsH protease
MTAWIPFFQGELGAAAAFAGLLFVSVSMNQARILSLGRMADRGLEALAMLFLAVAVCSLALAPGQPPRWFGGEVLALALALMVLLVPLQRGYLAALEPEHRPRSSNMVWANRAAMMVEGVGGALILGRGDGLGVYFLAGGLLLIFAMAAANAWVLLIEINR